MIAEAKGKTPAQIILQMRSLHKETRFFNMNDKGAEQFMLNWKVDD